MALRSRKFPHIVHAVFVSFLVVLFSCAAGAQAKIVLLGTGTPRPFPDRSGPSTAIVVGDRVYLVDFGPGVVRRAAAAAEEKGVAALNPANIKVAFVTHLHSDHTAGLPDLILTPWVMGRSQLDIYGPAGIEDMTSQVLAAWRQDIDIRMKGLEHREAPPGVRAHDVKVGVVYKDDRVTVTAFKVPHGEWPEAFGYRFDTSDRSIVISGDTTPSDALIALARDADVLVHEVMHLPSIEKLIATEPNAKTLREHLLASHTTTEQVGVVATKARVKTLVLSHLVPSEPPGAVPDDTWVAAARKHFKGNVVLGRDLLEI